MVDNRFPLYYRWKTESFFTNISFVATTSKCAKKGKEEGNGFFYNNKFFNIFLQRLFMLAFNVSLFGHSSSDVELRSNQPNFVLIVNSCCGDSK